MELTTADDLWLRADSTTRAIEVLYIGLFGRAADQGSLAYWSININSGALSREQLRSHLVNDSPEYEITLGTKSRSELLVELYERLFERAVEAEGLDYWVNGGGAGVNADQLVPALYAAALGDDRTTLSNKFISATTYTANTSDELYIADAAMAAVEDVDSGYIEGVPRRYDYYIREVWHRRSLTSGDDNPVVGSADELITSQDIEGLSSWGLGDVIDGQAGDDTLLVTTAGPITLGAEAWVRNVETVTLISGGAITLNTAGFTGTTALNATTSDSGQTLVVAMTTDVTSTVLASTDDVVSIDGGRHVHVSLSESIDNGEGAILLANVAGTVTVRVTGVYSDGADVASADTTISDGTTVSVTNSAGITATQVNAAAFDTSNFTVIQGDVVVNGGAATSTVTVIQDAAVTARDATVGDGRIGIVAGAVTITDINSASSTAVGTITSISLSNAGGATINSGALQTLNLAGILTTVDAGTLGALSSDINTQLSINLSGAATSGAVTIDSDISRVIISSSVEASIFTSFLAEGVKSLNVLGDTALTLQSQDLASGVDIVVSNTGGLTLGSALDNGASFSGGVGVDAIITGDSIERVITMGAGDDTVTYGGVASTTAGKLGSVAAGSGRDTLVMSNSQAAAADGTAAFNNTWTGFETLRLSDTLAENTTLDLESLNGVSRVELTGGGAHATSSILDNLVSGGTVVIAGPNTGVVVRVVAAAASANDSLTFHFDNDTANSNAYGTVTANEIESIHLITRDSGLNESSLATRGSLTLVASDVTTLTLAGNNGLDLSHAENTVLTTFDASGIIGDGDEDSPALLGVSFTSANATTTAKVSITGGAGHDVLKGHGAQDSIDGGAGADLIAGGDGADTITLGIGRNTIAIGASAEAGSESASEGWDVIKDFRLATVITEAVDLKGDSHQAVAALHAASSVGGNNMSLLSLAASNDRLGHQTLNVAADAFVETGQAAGVSYTIASGILTLGGVNATAVDTLEEWLAEAEAAASVGGETLAFEFESSTYVFAENGNADIFVELSGLTGAAALALTSNATTGIANTLYLADTLV